MSLESTFYEDLDITPREWQDCKYYMIEEKGLQFCLSGASRREFLSWVVRSKNETYKKRIKDIIEYCEGVDSEKA